jgi:NAD(P)-dependent dehydrogenase (short-subunit alcohol dehydrogenase family)
MHTALITGAGGNLGRAIVEKMLKEGYRVVGSLSPGDSKFDLVHENLQTFPVDLMDEHAAEEFVSPMIKKGQIDVAVLTVGGFAMGSIADSSADKIISQIKLNFQTAYQVVRPVFVQMQKQGYGRIFLIGSKPGSDMRYSKKIVGYGLSKSLLFRLAELMIEETKGTEVVTHVIVPSTIDTPQNREAMPEADYSKWVTPGAIADIIHFHCSKEASAIREPVIKVYNNS